MHDPRIGRFLSIDPLAPDYPHNSPYTFSENRVIDAVELEGLEKQVVHYVYKNNGNVLVTVKKSENPLDLKDKDGDLIVENSNSTLVIITTLNKDGTKTTRSQERPGTKLFEWEQVAFENSQQNKTYSGIGWKVEDGEIVLTNEELVMAVGSKEFSVEKFNEYLEQNVIHYCATCDAKGNYNELLKDGVENHNDAFYHVIIKGEDDSSEQSNDNNKKDDK